MSCVIELRRVGFSAQGRTLVSDVSLRLGEGKSVALVGPSGGGKSTVLKLAAGLLMPDGGSVFFRGKEIAKMSRQENLDFRREGAFVFQDGALWANQTLFQTLELPLRVHFPAMTSKERGERVEAAAARVGYKRELGIRPSGLSWGEQKLIAFARALICGPTLLFLDEWTESLDEKGAQRLIGIARGMKDDGASILFVSHDIRIIRRIADAVMLVAGGGIACRLAADEISCDEDLERLVEMGAA